MMPATARRPLLITDCDEVLLHMVSHFDAWLGEAHGIRFAFETGNFGEAMTDTFDRRSRSREDRVWPLLEQFFRQEMHRQTIVPGAVEALGQIGEIADIVILTNLGDEAHPWRVDQLARARNPARSRLQSRRQGRSGAGHHRSLRGGLDRVRRRPSGPSCIGRQTCAGSASAAYGRRAAACPGRSNRRACHMHGSTTGRRPRLDLRKAGSQMTKTIFITGVTAGIGAATARKFVGAGLAGRRHRPAPRPARRTGRRTRRLLPPGDARHALPGRFRARAGSACRSAIAASTCCSTMPGWRRR